MDNILTVSDIHKSYTTEKEILKGISLEIKKGEVVSVVGPSGSGKTTLLRCLSFLEKSDRGQIDFMGRSFDMAGISHKDIRSLQMGMGFVFQSFNLFANKTVMDNVLEGLIVARKWDRKEASDRAEEVLRKVGMLDWAKYYPGELSGGQQQRVAIARAVAPRPDIIFFDEPTSALDPELTKEVLGVIDIMAKSGVTMIVVTHEMEFARGISNRIIFMEDGRIVEEGDTRKLFESPDKERTRQFLGERGY